MLSSSYKQLEQRFARLRDAQGILALGPFGYHAGGQCGKPD
jgi:hypothetical protein